MTAVYCPNCGAFVGFYTLRDGQVWLVIGNLVVHDTYGNCLECGDKFTWHSSDKQELCVDNPGN